MCTPHWSPLFAAKARRRPSRDTSKFPNCQIFRSQRRGVKVTLRAVRVISTIPRFLERGSA